MAIDRRTRRAAGSRSDAVDGDVAFTGAVALAALLQFASLDISPLVGVLSALRHPMTDTGSRPGSPRAKG